MRKDFAHWVTQGRRKTAAPSSKSRADVKKELGELAAAPSSYTCGWGNYNINVKYPEWTKPLSKTVWELTIFMGKTSVVDPLNEDYTWDIYVNAFPWGPERPADYVGAALAFDVSTREYIKAPTEWPGGALTIAAYAPQEAQALYLGDSENVKKLTRAIEGAAQTLFTECPFDIVLDCSGGYKISGGGGGGSGSGLKQIRRPQWVTMCGGSGGSGGSGNWNHGNGGGDGWRAFLPRLKYQNFSQELVWVGAGPQIPKPIDDTDISSDGAYPWPEEKNGFVVMQCGIFDQDDWNQRNRPDAIGVLMGPFSGEKPVYIGSRRLYVNETDAETGQAARTYLPLGVPVRQTFSQINHPDEKKTLACMYWDFPVTRDHMQAIAASGRYYATSYRVNSSEFFVAENVHWSLRSYANWGWRPI